MPPSDKNRSRECQKCLVHGVHVRVKGHKGDCFYQDCQCQKCEVVNMKRQKNKLVIAQKRRLEMNKHKNTEYTQNETKQTDESSGFEEIDVVAEENYHPNSPQEKRAVYCRRCQVHGVKVLLRGHKDKCPYRACWCTECRILSNCQAYSSCSHCGHGPPVPPVTPAPPVPYPFPSSLYRVSPLLHPPQNARSTGVPGPANGYYDYQPQMNCIQMQPSPYSVSYSQGYMSFQGCQTGDQSMSSQSSESSMGSQ